MRARDLGQSHDANDARYRDALIVLPGAKRRLDAAADPGPQREAEAPTAARGTPRSRAVQPRGLGDNAAPATLERVPWLCCT